MPLIAFLCTTRTSMFTGPFQLGLTPQTDSDVHNRIATESTATIILNRPRLEAPTRSSSNVPQPQKAIPQDQFSSKYAKLIFNGSSLNNRQTLIHDAKPIPKYPALTSHSAMSRFFLIGLTCPVFQLWTSLSKLWPFHYHNSVYYLSPVSFRRFRSWGGHCQDAIFTSLTLVLISACQFVFICIMGNRDVFYRL